MRSEYQQILDDAFRSQFSEWDLFSPLDPLKMIAESLGESLVAIEKRQRRISTAISDSLPSLFGFQPKAARCPRVAVQFMPAAKLAETVQTSDEMRFRMVTELETQYVKPLHAFAISPVFDFSTEIRSMGVGISFRVESEMEELSLTYIPKAIGGSGATLRNVSMQVEKPSGKKFRVGQVKAIDETRGFTAYGNVTLCGLDLEKKDRVELYFEFEQGLPEGRLLPNVALCEISSIESEVELGALQGQLWEQIKLGDTLTEPPSQLQLRFPNDRQMTLNRVESEILKVRAVDFPKYKESFFYNAVNHELVIPCADALMSGFNGGVTIKALNVKTFPQAVAYGDDARTPADYPKLLDKLSPVAVIEGSQKRESTEAYLSRFYSEIRLFSASLQSERAVNLQELHAQILKADSRIRRVEYVCDGTSRESMSVRFYLLLEDPQSIPVASTHDEVFEKVKRLVATRLPLDIQFSVLPFYRVPLQLEIESENYSASFSEVMLDQAKKLLSPAPFGEGLSTDAISKESFHKMLLGDSTRSRASLKLIYGREKVFLDRLARKSGELFDVSVTVEPFATSRSQEVLYVS